MRNFPLGDTQCLFRRNRHSLQFENLGRSQGSGSGRVTLGEEWGFSGQIRPFC